MVVIICLPADRGRDLVVHLFDWDFRVEAYVVLLERRDAGCVHPAFDDEGPAVEGDDWAEEAGGSDGREGSHFWLLS